MSKRQKTCTHDGPDSAGKKAVTRIGLKSPDRANGAYKRGN
ncbi:MULTISPECIES: hypothetical protein [unclassified Microcoleus]